MKNILLLCLIGLISMNNVFGQVPEAPDVDPNSALLVGKVDFTATAIAGEDYVVARDGNGNIVGLALTQTDPDTGEVVFAITVYDLPQGTEFFLQLYDASADTYTTLTDSSFIYQNKNGGLLDNYAFDTTYTFVGAGTGSGGGGGGNQTMAFGVPLLPYEWLICLLIVGSVAFIKKNIFRDEKTSIKWIR